MDILTLLRFEARITAALIEIELRAIETDLSGFWSDYRVLQLRRDLEARRSELREWVRV